MISSCDESTKAGVSSIEQHDLDVALEKVRMHLKRFIAKAVPAYSSP